MSKLFRSLAVVAGFVAFVVSTVGSAHAATTTSDFQVDVTLTPRCFINIDTTTPGSQNTTDIALSYVAFQTTAAQASTGFTVRCSNTLPFSIALDSDTGTAAGITYYLKVALGGAQYTGSTGGGTLAGQAGTGGAEAYSIGAEAPAGQAGTCNAVAPATCTASGNHQITVTY